MNLTMADAVRARLAERGETVTFAESCTGGLLAGELVGCAGASDVLRQSVVTYANEAKERILGVKRDTLDKFGAVSEECACEMALGALNISGADWAASVTGIAGPDGGTPEKPVGTVWIAVAHDGVARARRFAFRGGDRQWIRTLSVVNALNMLRMAMIDEEADK